MKFLNNHALQFMISNHLRKLLSYFARIMLPVTFGISFVISTGPSLQKYALSLLNTDVPSIYGSVNHDDLIEFYDLSSWMRVGIHWLYILMAVPIALVVIRSKTPRSQMWNGAVVSFAVMSIIDIIYSLLENSFSMRDLAQNLPSNFIGGAAVSMFIIAFFSASEMFYMYVPLSTRWKKRLCAYVVLLLGMFLCCLTYYICDVFYSPLPARIEVFFSSPSQWVIKELAQTEVKTKPADDSKNKIKFSILPQKSIPGTVSWTTLSDQTVSLLPSPEAKKYRVEVGLLTGSCSPQQIAKLKISSMTYSFEDVQKASFSFDKGISIFSSIKTNEKNVRYSVDPENGSNLYISQNTKDKRIQLTELVSSKTSLSLFNSDGNQNFLIAAPLAVEAANKFQFQSRVLSINVNKQNLAIRFDPDKRLLHKKEPECALANLGHGSDSTANSGQKVIFGGLFGSVLVRISPQRLSDTINMDLEGIRTQSTGGWIQFSDLEPETLDNYKIGDVGMLQVRGNVSDFIVDNVPVAIKQMTTYTAMGAFQVEYGDNGKIKASGTAKHLWMDERRVNQTKWEKLALETKLALLSFLVAIFGAVGRLVSKQLSSNSRFSWVA